jgi:hypothetical protein
MHICYGDVKCDITLTIVITFQIFILTTVNIMLKMKDV